VQLGYVCGVGVLPPLELEEEDGVVVVVEEVVVVVEEVVVVGEEVEVVVVEVVVVL
jgi:hypothetical protein